MLQLNAARRTRKRKDALVQREIGRLEQRVAKLEAEQKCKICLEHEATLVYVPCGHRSCAQCYQHRREQAGNTHDLKCHICRQVVRSTIRMFNS